MDVNVQNKCKVEHFKVCFQVFFHVGLSDEFFDTENTVHLCDSNDQNTWINIFSQGICTKSNEINPKVRGLKVS